MVPRTTIWDSLAPQQSLPASQGSNSMNNPKNIKLLEQKTNKPTNQPKERGKEWDEGVASKFTYPSLCPIYRKLTWITSNFCRSRLGFALFVFLLFPSLFLSPVLHEEAKTVNSMEVSSDSFSMPWRGDLQTSAQSGLSILLFFHRQISLPLHGPLYH